LPIGAYRDATTAARPQSTATEGFPGLTPARAGYERCSVPGDGPAHGDLRDGRVCGAATRIRVGACTRSRRGRSWFPPVRLGKARRQARRSDCPLAGGSEATARYQR